MANWDKPVLRTISKKLDRSLSMQESFEIVPERRRKHSSLLLRWTRTNRDENPTDVEEGYDNEYVDCGTSPPLDSVLGSFISVEDSTNSQELSVQICFDTIKSNLLEHMKSKSGRQQLLDDIESKKIIRNNFEETFSGASEAEVNVAFIWSALMKRWDLLDGFLEIGADLQYHEPIQGMGALHLAAFSGCLVCTEFLIGKGIDANVSYQSYAPLHWAAFGDSPGAAMILLNNGARVGPSRTTSGRSKKKELESVLHCAVRANAVACVHLFIAEKADVEHLGHSGLSPLHLAADLGHTECLKVMTEASGVNINIKSKEKNMTPLHLAAEAGFIHTIALLLERGADSNARDHRGQTPLLLAARAQAFDCVEMLLKKGKADPNMGDGDLRTPLHAAVGKAASSTDIIKMLIGWGADVNTKDEYDYTPLHMAAINELSKFVEILIYHGADVTAKSKAGVSALSIISRKTPTSLEMVTQKLDSALTLHNNHESSNRDVELRLNFRSILQNSNPGEVRLLNTFVDEGQKKILLHPLCSAFLYLKWEKIRKYYISRMLFYFVYVMCLSVYVFPSFLNETANLVIWYVLVAVLISEVLRKLYGIFGYINVKQYLEHPDNLIEWIMILGVFVIVLGRACIGEWANFVGAFVVLFGWTNLMLMIGQLPFFGLYVAMYTKVQGEFAKLLLAYSCLLIGFTISFCVIFPDAPTFSNPFTGFLSVLTMMTGEISMDLFTDNSTSTNATKDFSISLGFQITAQLLYLLFVLFVTVTLMNLLVGIAVHDIQGLQKTAEQSKLVRQTKLIYYMELALFNRFLPKFLLNFLQWTALVSPNAYRVVVGVKPLNPREKRLPREILHAAYEIARENKLKSSKFCTASKGRDKYFSTNIEKSNEPIDYTCNIEKLQQQVDRNAENLESLIGEVRGLKKLLLEVLHSKTDNETKQVDENETN